MREIVETMKNCGVEFKELRITGGASKSPLWRQIMADILNLPLRRLVVSDATVLGAAIIAASIKIVPEPQKGSRKLPSALTRTSFAIAAASVSRIGASFEFFR